MIEQGGLDVLETRHADRRHRRWPRYAAVATVIMVAAGLVAVPRLATHLERTDLTSLARTWAERTALDEARLSILTTITNAVPPDGFAAAHQATTAVLREEEDRLARLAAQLDHLRLWRSGPKHVRALMRAALLDERKTLAVATTQPLAQQTTLPAGALTDKADRADRALNAAMRKSHVRTANVPAANLRAAERYLAHERQLLDDAPPYRVVVTSNGNSYLLDLASSTVGTNTSPFSSYHQEAFTVDGVTLLQGQPPVVVDSLGNANTLSGIGTVAGPRPGRLWLVRQGTQRIANQVAESDLRGHVLTRWYSLPKFTVAIAGTRLGVVIQQSREITDEGTAPIFVFDPISGRRQRLASSGYVLAATRDTVVLMSQHGDVTIRQLGATSPVLHLHLNVVAPYVCCGPVGDAVSPDGRLLALAPVHAERATRVALLDLRTGQVRTLSGPEVVSVAGPMSWSPDGKQLFFTTGESGWPLARYVVGGQHYEYVRWTGTDAVDSLAVIPAR